MFNPSKCGPDPTTALKTTLLYLVTTLIGFQVGAVLAVASLLLSFPLVWVGLSELDEELYELSPFWRRLTRILRSAPGLRVTEA